MCGRENHDDYLFHSVDLGRMISYSVMVVVGAVVAVVVDDDVIRSF